MTDISVNGLVKSFELGKNILDGLSFDIAEGERVGILGHNGCGKTTLFRILTGEIDYDEGTVAIASGKRLGLISQIPVYPDGWTTEDVLKDAHRELYAISAKLDELAERMETDQSGKLLSEYDRLSADFARLGGFDMDTDRSRVANGLDIPQSMREQPFDQLSGGERTRVNLARLILEKTDILLLDEPTNHLDLIYQKQIFALIGQWLQTPGRAVVSVVHDLSLARAFGTDALLMDSGRKIALGRANDVLTPANLDWVYGMDVAAWMRGLYSQWAE